MLTDRLEVDKFATARFVRRRRRPPPRIVLLLVSWNMKTRLTATVLAVAALGYACGPRTHADATTSSTVAPQGFALASMAAPIAIRSNTRERMLTKETVTLSPTFDVQQEGNGIRFAFQVVNATGKRVEIKF